MKLTKEEFWEMNEIDFLINTVVKLSEILFKYEGEKESLIDILLEKAKLLENKFDKFSSCLIKEQCNMKSAEY